MTRNRFRVLLWSMSIGALPWFTWITSSAGTELRLSPDRSLATLLAENRSAGSPIEMWKECGDESRRYAAQLCDAPDAGFDYTASKILLDILNNGVSDVELLCRIEAIVQSSQALCSPPEPSYVENFSVAVVLERLAKNWWDHGTLVRADQLYDYAYLVLDAVPRHQQDTTLLQKQAEILQYRTILNFKMGDHEATKVLATRLGETARKALEVAGPHRTFVLPFTKQYILFQAAVFQDLGLVDEARTLREEADRL